MNFRDYNVFNLKKPKYTTDTYNANQGNISIKVVENEIIVRQGEDIDSIAPIDEPHLCSGVVYLLEVMDSNSRILYVGSTRNLSHRLKQHKNNLQKDKHHNKRLQTLYNDLKEPTLKITCIDGIYHRVNPDIDLVELENDWVVEIASRYHNTLDRFNRRVKVVYSR